MEHGPIPPDDPPPFIIDKTKTEEMRRRSGMLRIPPFPPILRPKDRPIVADHPSPLGIYELDSAQSVFAAAVLRRPGLTAVIGMQDRPFLADDPTLFGIDEKDPIQILWGPGRGRNRPAPRGASRCKRHTTHDAEKEPVESKTADRSVGHPWVSCHFTN